MAWRREMWLGWDSTFQDTASVNSFSQKIRTQRHIQTKVCIQTNIFDGLWSSVIVHYKFPLYFSTLRLIQQMEVGLNKRIANQWIPPKPSCGSSSRAKQYVSVSVKETYLTLAIFGFGVCISMLIFILEVLHHIWMNRGLKKNVWK